MKKLLMTLMLCSLTLLSGCDDKDARDYAHELVGVLKSYQAEVNQKIKVEQESYKDLASTYAYARQVDVHTRLQNERLRLSGSLTDSLMSGDTKDTKITPSTLHGLVADYAKHDFEATRQMLEEESDGQAEYLASLESLELQAQSIESLTKALEELAKPKSDIKKIKELGLAAKEFKDKLDALGCEELARQIACLKAKLDGLSVQAEKDKVQAEIDRLADEMSNSGCNANLLNTIKCPDKKGA
jgi:uncharacterized lipoprotein NlpE involved in copper resistance